LPPPTPAPPDYLADRLADHPADDGEGDHPASALDGLFVPRLHGLSYGVLGRRAINYGLALAGHDRMEKHRWAAAGLWQTAAGGEPSWSLAYTNRALAPLTIRAAAMEDRFHDVPRNADGSLPADGAPLTLFRRDREATLDLSRSFWSNPVGVGFLFYETYRPDDLWVRQALNRFGGVRLFAAFTGAEDTPYTSVRRALLARVAAAFYPHALTTVGFDITDLRGELATYVPLPLLARHTLYLRLRGRTLLGTSTGDGLLDVGGTSSALVLARRSNQPETTLDPPDALPVGIMFNEFVTGFEDHPFRADRIVIAGAFYTYPFIIDWGTASTLGILPALFVRQVDLGLFGNVATDGRDDNRHAVAGGSLTLQSAFWQVGLDLRYQLARRLTDDHALVHLVTLGIGG
jgi:hypothetical protein